MQHSFFLVTTVVILAVILSCGGEVTTLDFGAEQEDSFERYRDEVQPILQYNFGGDVDGKFIIRNCTLEGACHGPPLGTGGLVIFPDASEEELNANHQSVLDKINRGDPASSILLTDPLNLNQDHPITSFTGEDDCCYMKIYTWIADEPSPECECIVPE